MNAPVHALKEAAMPVKYKRLFEPVHIGKVRLKNRIAMAPMGFPALQDETGQPTQRYIDYFVERAKGGAGLVMTGMLKVEETIEYTTRKRGPVRPSFTRPFADLTETVHSLGCKMFAQLSAGFGAEARSGSVTGGPVSASAVPSWGDPKVICRELSVEDIQFIVNAYGDAAEILARAGVDGVELHGHAGFLLDQFSTTLWNKRTDRYGGDLRGRMTFAFEIFDEIKRRVGPDYPVTYRYGLRHYLKSMHQAALPGEDYVEVGRGMDEGLEMARLLEEKGFDALAVDAGTLAGHYWAHPPIYQKHGCMLDLSAATKQVVKIPVMAVGRLDVPDLAEAALENGEADVITLGKALLADPYWPNKVLENRIDDIRPCIGCHQACTESFHGRELNSCTVNPACGRERTYQVTPALAGRKVLVVGGGAAGMEVARVAASRGHSVTLFEKDDTLGGHLRDASVPGEKGDIGRLNTWMQRQLALHDVNVRTGSKITPDVISAESPDVIVVATGSVDVVPRFPGYDKPHVATATQVLLGTKHTGQRVVIVGAGENGCEIGLWLAQQGKQVTIIEKLATPINIPVARANKNMLLDSLVLHQVPIITETALEAIEDDAVVVISHDGDRKRIACDTVILAVGMRADNEVFEGLLGKYPAPVYAIGDCDGPKNIMKAIWDGFEVARQI
jgi:2-enoate reductase